MAGPSRAALQCLTILDEVDSTNLALQRLPLEEQHGQAIIADRQSAGRGRHGRRWYSPPGGNIYLSLGWNFQRAADSLTLLPLAVAVMAVRCLRRAGLGGTGIKWPNDIQIAGRKLAGILVELSCIPGGRARAVIGIGVNVRMPADETSRLTIDQPWTDVCSHLGRTADPGLRNQLAGMLLDYLVRGVGQFATQGFDAFAEDWKRWDALRGREVAVLGTEEPVFGIAQGISKRGGLLVTCRTESGENGVCEYFAGEVRIRSA